MRRVTGKTGGANEASPALPCSGEAALFAVVVLWCYSLFSLTRLWERTRSPGAEQRGFGTLLKRIDGTLGPLTPSVRWPLRRSAITGFLQRD